MESIKSKASHLFIWLLLNFLFFFWIPTAFAAFTSIYSDYADEHNILNNTNTIHTFNEKVIAPPKDFKVFVPPGTIGLSFTVFTGQSDEYAVAVRGNIAPQCTYNELVDDYAYLPWKPPGSANLSAILTRDYQFKNIDGGISVFNGGVSAPASGEWIYVKGISYDTTSATTMTFTVTVNVAAFNAWYQAQFPTNTGNPDDIPGTSGGVCEPEWVQGCISNCGDPNPPPNNTDNQAPVITLINPQQGSPVSGLLNLSANVSDNQAVARVDFFIDTGNSVAANGTLSSGNTSNGTWVGTFDTTKINNGTHQVWAKAVDTSNNSAVTQSVTIQVNNTTTHESQSIEIDQSGANGFPYYTLTVGANSVEVNPTMILPSFLTGTYQLVAAVIKDGEIWVADKLFEGITTFYPFSDVIKYYDEVTLNGTSDQLPCTAFENWVAIDLATLKQHTTAFFIAIQNKNLPEEVYAAVFVFQ